MSKQNSQLSRMGAFSGQLAIFLIGSALLWAFLSGAAMALAWVARSLGFELGDDSWIGIRGLLINALVIFGGSFAIYFVWKGFKGKGVFFLFLIVIALIMVLALMLEWIYRIFGVGFSLGVAISLLCLAIMLYSFWRDSKE